MSTRLGTIPIEVSLSANRLVTNSSSACYEVIGLCRFAGFDNLDVGRRSATRSGNKSVVGKITLAEGTIGHEQIVAQTLRTVWDNMKSFEQDRVFHMGGTSVPLR